MISDIIALIDEFGAKAAVWGYHAESPGTDVELQSKNEMELAKEELLAHIRATQTTAGDAEVVERLRDWAALLNENATKSVFVSDGFRSEHREKAALLIKAANALTARAAPEWRVADAIAYLTDHADDFDARLAVEDCAPVTGILPYSPQALADGIRFSIELLRGMPTPPVAPTEGEG